MSANAERGASPAWGTLLLAVTVVLPACLAALHAGNVADAAHDEAVLRALGFGWTGAFRALDAPWSGLFSWLPVGTRALRGALGSAVAAGVGGGVLYVTARGLLERTGTPTHPRVASGVGPVVAAIASLAATLSPSWQAEAAAPAGTTLGAALALLPGALLIALEGEARAPLVALSLGASLSYEPLVGLSALASVLGYAGFRGSGGARVTLTPREIGKSAAAFLLGLVPFVLAFARRDSPLASAASVFARLAGERGESPAGMPLAFVREDVGLASSLFVVAGAALAWRASRARAAAAAMVGGVVAALVAMAVGAPAGPTRYGAAILAGVGGAYALAAVAMQRLVSVVAEAKIPFARASATMIVVLEAALPARAADDSSARAEDRAKGASEGWDEAAWGGLPAGSIVLVRDPQVELRFYAERGAGELRGDVALVPLFDLAGRGASRELARDPKLMPVWRDAALVGAQEEWSLSQLAGERPLIAAYDPAWDRGLARHLVPVGLLARFEPEPRGGSDRRRALEDLSPMASPPAGAPILPSPRDRLARAIEADPELLALTARLLRVRAIALAAASERDVVAHAIDDLRPFSPRDTVAAELVRRMATSRGAIDVKDLAP